MTFAHLPIPDFLGQLAEGTPAPGGGAAAALAGSCAAALVSMVAHLSPLEDGERRAQLEQVLDRAGALRIRLAEEVDRDAAAYSAVIEAGRFPHATATETEIRSVALRAAWRHAIQVPLDMARECLEVMVAARFLVENGNPRVRADATAGLYLASAAMRIALLNIDANLPGVQDQSFSDTIRGETARLEDARLALEFQVEDSQAQNKAEPGRGSPV